MVALSLIYKSLHEETTAKILQYQTLQLFQTKFFFCLSVCYKLIVQTQDCRGKCLKQQGVGVQSGALALANPSVHLNTNRDSLSDPQQASLASFETFPICELGEQYCKVFPVLLGFCVRINIK